MPLRVLPSRCSSRLNAVTVAFVIAVSLSCAVSTAHANSPSDCLHLGDKSLPTTDVFTTAQTSYTATTKQLIVKDVAVGSGTSFNIDGSQLPDRREEEQWDAVISNVRIPTAGGRMTIRVSNGARVLVDGCQFGTTPSNANALTAIVTGGSTLVIYNTKLGGNFALQCKDMSYCAFLHSEAIAASEGQVLPSWRIDTQARVLLQDSTILCPSGVCELTWASVMTGGSQVVFRRNVLQAAGSHTHATNTAGATVVAYYNTWKTSLQSTVFGTNICTRTSSSTPNAPGTCPAQDCDVDAICDTRFAGVTASIVAGVCTCDCSAASPPTGSNFDCQPSFDTDDLRCTELGMRTPTVSRSETISVTATVPATPSPTTSSSPSGTLSRSASLPPTSSATATISSSASPTATASHPPTATNTLSLTQTFSLTRTKSASATAVVTVSEGSASESPSVESTASASVSGSDVSASDSAELPDLGSIKNAAADQSIRLNPSAEADAAASAGAVAAAAISPPIASKPTAIQRTTAAIGMCDSDEYVDDGFPSVFTFVPWVAVGTDTNTVTDAAATGGTKTADPALTAAVSNAAGASMFTGGFAVIAGVVVMGVSFARARGANVPGIEQPLAKLGAVTLVSFCAAFLFPSVMEACVFVATSSVASRTQVVTAVVGGGAMVLASLPVAVVTFGSDSNAAHNARSTVGVLTYLMDEIVAGSKHRTVFKYRVASLLDVVTALFVGVCAGLLRANSKAHCDWAPGAMCIAAVGLLGYYCVLRPLVNKVEQAVITFVSFLQALVSVLVFATLQFDRTLAPVTERMSVAFEIIALVAPAILAADALRSSCLERQKNRAAQLASQRRALRKARGELSTTSSSSSLDSDAALAYVQVQDADASAQGVAVGVVVVPTGQPNAGGPPPPRAAPVGSPASSPSGRGGGGGGGGGGGPRLFKRGRSRHGAGPATWENVRSNISRPVSSARQPVGSDGGPLHNPLLQVPTKEDPSVPPRRATSTAPVPSPSGASQNMINEATLLSALAAANAGYSPQQGGVSAVPKTPHA